MKYLILTIALLSFCSLAYAAAEDETGDFRTVPCSLYGKQADGTITMFAVDENGRLKIDGGNSGIGVFEVVGGELQLDMTNSGYNVNIQTNLSVTDTITAANVYATDIFGTSGNITADGTLSISNVFYVEDNGNVGIGITNPSQKLDVVGNSELNGVLTVTGDSYLGGQTLFVDQSTGNVGIGMYTPGHVFGIQSALSAEPKLLLQNINADAQAPEIIFRHFSASPADDDNIGRINFDGYDSTLVNTYYVRMDAMSPTVADGSESGLFRLYVCLDDGSPGINSFFECTGIASNARTTFNQDSKDIDFIVESDNDAGALFVQGSDGNVGIGTTAPTNDFVVVGTTTTLCNTLSISGGVLYYKGVEVATA